MVLQSNFTRNNFRSMLLQKVTGTKIRPDLWEVPSVSRDGINYQVKARWIESEKQLGIECRCKSGQVNHGCKHGMWVMHQIMNDPWLLEDLRQMSGAPALGQIPRATHDERRALSLMYELAEILTHIDLTTPVAQRMAHDWARIDQAMTSALERAAA